VNILHICLEFDCAGVAWNLAQAINSTTSDNARHVMRRKTHAAANTDFLFEDAHELLPHLQWADVLHFHQWIWTYTAGALQKRSIIEFDSTSEQYVEKDSGIFKSFLKEKKVAFHFHGGHLQLQPQYWIDRCAEVGATMFTCDPLADLPGACWMPNVLDSIAVEIAPKRGDLLPFVKGKMPIAVMGDLSDTRRNNKHIKQVLDHLGINSAFFGTIPRAESFRMRRNFPISIDNITQGFIGMWGWESLVMGHVLLARIAPAAKNAYERLGPSCPIVHVENVNDIGQKVLELQKNMSHFIELSLRGRSWMKQYYNAQKIANMYIKEYHDINS